MSLLIEKCILMLAA